MKEPRRHGRGQIAIFSEYSLQQARGVGIPVLITQLQIRILGGILKASATFPERLSEQRTMGQILNWCKLAYVN